ncbi:MAG TPA: substrate-binding domain-containing protein [Terracidiphilus sp.]|nr:substrate-binding domain-containing protein [Terracidiphilus sp.]
MGSQQERIAVIPQTEGLSIWDFVHVGAENAADRIGASVYWNAPTRQDDVEAQIALVDRVVSSGYQGLVLAPDQSLALISPVRRALAKGIPTAIIGSPLLLPPDKNLVSILNDDEMSGRLAAQRVALLLHNKGTVALLGINPDIASIMIRTRAFEQELARIAPEVRIVERREGTYNGPHEQMVAEDVLRAHPDVDVIVAMMWMTADGSLRALDSLGGDHGTKVVTFDSDGPPPFDHWPRLDAVIQEDTRSMGQKAVEAIDAKLHGRAVPPVTKLAPILITRDNANSAAVHKIMSLDWQIGNWRWDPIQ